MAWKKFYVSIMCVSCSSWIRYKMEDKDFTDHCMGAETATLVLPCEKCGCVQDVVITRMEEVPDENKDVAAGN